MPKSYAQAPGSVRLLALISVLATALAAITGCNSTSTVATGPTPVKCTVALTLSQGTMDASGGAGSVSVTTAAECTWSVSSTATWITGLSPATGQGNGQILFQVTANPSQTPRQADIVVNDVHARLNQGSPACSITIAPTSQSVAAGGDSGSIHVSGAGGCAWTATSGATWLTVTSGSPGDGNGSVTFTAAANTGTIARIGTITIAGQTFTVAQPEPGAPPCLNTIQPASQSMSSGGGNTTVNIQATSSCSWTATSNVPWLAVVGVGAGVGNGAVTIAASANTGTARTGTATIAGQTFTVTQSGSCLATLNPASASLGSAAANGPSVAVTIATGCAWTASTADSWISISSGATGNGNGTVAFSVTANTGAARTGSIAIGGQSFNVTQAGSCLASINPASQSVPASAGPGASVAVTTPSGCAWTATTSTPWITITSGATGNGNGSVSFTVVANPNTTTRAGAITIAGQTHNVTQAGACPIGLNAASQTVGAGAGAGTAVGVTAPAGCAWTATTAATWINLANPASGTGNGTVNFTVTANTGPQRVDTITIGGQTHTVTQSSGCTFSINPNSDHVTKNPQTGATITVTAGASCTWTAVSNDTWITVVTGATGTGNGTVTFSVTNNNTGSQRIGTLTIAGRTFTVTQDK